MANVYCMFSCYNNVDSNNLFALYKVFCDSTSASYSTAVSDAERYSPFTFLMRGYNATMFQTFCALASFSLGMLNVQNCESRRKRCIFRCQSFKIIMQVA